MQENNMKKDRLERNKQHAEWSKRTHKQMLEQGICYRCRKRKADVGYKTCGICRTKLREKRRVENYKPSRKERYKQGLCFFCDNPIKQGYKVCDKHYQDCVDKSHMQKTVQARQELIKQGILY